MTPSHWVESHASWVKCWIPRILEVILEFCVLYQTYRTLDPRRRVSTCLLYSSAIDLSRSSVHYLWLLTSSLDDFKPWSLYVRWPAAYCNMQTNFIHLKHTWKNTPTSHANAHHRYESDSPRLDSATSCSQLTKYIWKHFGLWFENQMDVWYGCSGKFTSW